MNKCIFLDRDGVINRERGDYTYRIEDFNINEGVLESIQILKESGYLLIVITNQAGISRNIYTREQMDLCHEYMKKELNYLLDDIFYCPYHPTVSNSLSRKPDSLMLEKAMAKYDLDPAYCWMIGDAERDVVAAHTRGIKTIKIGRPTEIVAPDFYTDDLTTAVDIILENS